MLIYELYKLISLVCIGVLLQKAVHSRDLLRKLHESTVLTRVASLVFAILLQIVTWLITFIRLVANHVVFNLGTKVRVQILQHTINRLLLLVLAAFAD